MPLLLRRLQTDKHLQSRVMGILVTSGSSQVPAKSPAERFPQAEYAPYEDTNYAWNPTGTGISSLNISIPIFHLEADLQAKAQAAAMQNGQQVMTPVGALCSCQSTGPRGVHERTFGPLLSYWSPFSAVTVTGLKCRAMLHADMTYLHVPRVRRGRCKLPAWMPPCGHMATPPAAFRLEAASP